MPSFSVKSAAIALLAFSATVTPLLTVPAAQAETAVAPEKNPPGDIPDTQVFITYSAASYALKVPEGWARTEVGTAVSFVSKLDGVSVTLSDAAIAPTLASVKAQYVADLIAGGRAVKITEVSTVSLPGGEAVRIDYAANSDPNPVTTKQIRLENARFLFWKAGKLAALDLYAPLGADNVDQWTLMSKSFAWH